MTSAVEVKEKRKDISFTKTRVPTEVKKNCLMVGAEMEAAGFRFRFLIYHTAKLKVSQMNPNLKIPSGI